MTVVPRSAVRVAAVGVAAMLVSCAGAPPSPYSWKPPAAGSTWEMAFRNTRSYGADKRVRFRVEERVWQGQRMLAFVSPDGSGAIRTPDHHQTAAVLGPGGKTLAEYEPPVGPRYPIAVGDSMTASSQLKIPGRELPPVMELKCVVEAFERVTVPAGTFDAYKTVCTPSSGKSVDTYWMSPELGIHVKTTATRADNSNFGAGTQVGELVSHTIR